jgi:TQXA domain-containing protein
MRGMMLSSGKFTQEEADALTDGIAMTATQYAIWTYSNERDGIRYINAYYTNKGTPNTPAPKEAADLIFKLYYYLISLEPSVIKPDEMDTYNTTFGWGNIFDVFDEIFQHNE